MDALQMRTLPLVITPGLSGWRLAFAGGGYYEPIAEFATVEQAQAARMAALAMTMGRRVAP